MIHLPKATVQLVLIGAIGGWLGGVCINASQGLLAGVMSYNALQAALVGTLSTAILAFPWVWTMKRRGWLVTGGIFGIIASLLALVMFFLFWPYDGHGRDAIHKTVLTMIYSYPVPFFGIGSLMGVYASSWIRPTQEGEHLWVDWILPGLILVGLGSIVNNAAPPEKAPEKELTADDVECCKMAYQAFVQKVGVSFAVFEAEKYCEVKCPIVTSCLDVCMETKDSCTSGETACKDSHRACVLACPID